MSLCHGKAAACNQLIDKIQNKAFKMYIYIIRHEKNIFTI